MSLSLPVRTGLQSRAYRFDKKFVTEGLAQKSDRAAGHRLLTHTDIIMRGHKNNGQAARLEATLRLKAADTRHLYIEDDARRLKRRYCQEHSQKFVPASERLRLDAHRSQQAPRRTPYRFIVIDNGS